MKPIRCLTISTAILVGAGFGACSSEPRSDAPPPPTAGPAAADSPPSDFTLAMTVTGTSTRRSHAAIPRENRPARFVVETDWVLRSIVGPGVKDAGFPPETRQLRREDIAALWTELRTAGLLDPNHAAAVGNPAVAMPSEGAASKSEPPTWIVTYTADGVRRTLLLKGEEQTPARPLLDRLSDLAWMAK